MTSLCYRAMNRTGKAREVLADVLQQVRGDNPWRGNLLQVAAWLARDEGDLEQAETYFKEAISLQSMTGDPDILVAGTLADLGEVLGLQKRYWEAIDCFEQSMFILKEHEAQYERQEARTLWKYAEMLRRRGNQDEALRLINKADDKVRAHGHYYDTMWRIELCRATIFWQKRQFKVAMQKLRMALTYRRKLNLPNRLLLKQLFGRWRRCRPCPSAGGRLCVVSALNTGSKPPLKRPGRRPGRLCCPGDRCGYSIEAGFRGVSSAPD